MDDRDRAASQAPRNGENTMDYIALSLFAIVMLAMMAANIRRAPHAEASPLPATLTVPVSPVAG